MKKMLVCLLALIMLALTCACAASAGNYAHVVGCESWVSLRKQPDKDSKRVLKIPLRAMVEYISDANDEFAYVSYGGNGGYVLKKYLSFINPVTSMPFSVPMYVAHCEKYVNLRASDSVKADSLAKLTRGAKVECLTTLGDEAEMAYVREYAFGNTARAGYVLKEF